MPNIQIGNRIINFPNSGRDANWSQAVIEFAVAVGDQLAGIASEFDISPRVQILTANTNTNLNVNDVVFPNDSVRGFSFNYAIYRETSTESVAETGFVNGVYDSDASAWNLQHEFEGPRQADGTPYHTFGMSGDQLTITTVSLPGVYNNVDSKISYAAKTILTANI